MTTPNNGSHVLRITTRGTTKEEFRARVEILDFTAFRAAVGERLCRQMVRLFAALDILVGVLDAATRCRGDSTRAHHSRLTMTLLAWGSLVEISTRSARHRDNGVLREFHDAAVAEGIAIPNLGDLLTIADRWGQRPELRNKLSFHFDNDFAEAGLSFLEQRGVPVMLIEEREGLPCFEIGNTALLGALDAQKYGSDPKPLLDDLQRDAVTITNVARHAIALIASGKNLAIEHRREEDSVINQQPAPREVGG